MINGIHGRALPGLATALLVSGCGAGVVGVAASSGSSSGGNSAPSIANLQVPSSKASPAHIRFELSDREGETVKVELSARVPGLGQAELLTQASSPDFPANGAAIAIPAGNQIKTIDVAWHFPDESFLPADGSFVEDIELIARLSSGTELVLGDDEPLSIGNDPPEVTDVTPIVDPEEGEAAGIVRVEVSVKDSSDDVVTIPPEFDVQGDVPDAGWQPATGFGLEDVRVLRGGTTLDFFWDTDADLHDLERQVALRFRPDDGTRDADENPIGRGEPFESLPFRVDNNAAPIVQLFNDAVISNPDELRGIHVPFRVIDEEGDRVEVIFQWRREEEEFPSLLESEIDAVLADPALRREKHICTEYPRFAHGLVVPIDATTVRLPELARGESWILASGLVGRTLELLRPSSIPEPITPTWASNPLVSPIAALPVDDGLTALVLDAPGNARLREIELATGAIVREIAMFGPGAPSAMALERGDQAVLVATNLSGVWRIERVELASGAITELAVSDGSQPGPVRGLASLGTSAAVFTAGSALFSLDYRDPLAPRLGTLLSGLATPWGVVVDPLPPGRLYLAEREAVTAGGRGRVLAVELDSHEELPVIVRTEGLQRFRRPSALALERNGTRMLVVTNQPGGASQLLGLDLGATGKNISFPIGPPRASEIASIASGLEELRCAALPGEQGLLIGGGLEQRRAIVAYESPGQEATLDGAFQPEARPGSAWRIPAELRPQLASSTGIEAAFLWSSGEDIGGGPAFLRALARDDELGLATEGRTPKQVRAALDVAPLVLGPAISSFPFSVAAADLDGDGDQDLVSTNLDGNNLTVFFQGSPGGFPAAPLVLGGPAITSAPRSVAAADLDGDGDQDLVSGNSGHFTGDGHTLTVFFQESPGSFAAEPLVLGGPAITNGPASVAAADLDADGDQDLVSANAGGHNLTVFFQGSPGSFAAEPLVLGGTAIISPRSVAAADLDGDGDQDLVSANAGNLIVFFQRSPGSFDAAPLVLGRIGITTSPTSVAAADLDGDGDQDLVSADRIGHNLTVFFQGSPGSFAAEPLVLGGFPITTLPRSVAAADLDGDGDQDLVSANASNLIVFFQRSPGSFVAAPLGITTSPRSVAAADLDGDGDQDLVSANFTSHNLTVFFQGSPGSFAAAPLVLGDFAITSTPLSVAAADLDGDGDQDLVSANAGGHNLTVFFQGSPGSFAAAPLVLGGPAITSFPVSVAAADLDGDGDQDLVSANQGGDTLTVFWGGR